MSDKSILESLLDFGISEIEAKIYLYLLNKQPQTIVVISRELNIPRTSIYDSVLKLQEKGLIQKHIFYKSQRFEAFPITILETLLDKEKARVEKLEDQFHFLEKNISLALTPATNTQVRYYHGQQGFMQMMWNALNAKNETIGYSEFGRAAIVGQKFLEKWMQGMISKRIVDKVITNPRDEVITYLLDNAQQARNVFQKTRFIEKDRLYVSGDTTIYNNIFAVAYWRQGEVVGVEIENEELVKTQKSIFEEMWKLAKPLKS